MAEIYIRQLIDDLDGKPIDTGLAHEVTFAYQGADYRIDLRPTNADKIEAVFAPYIKVAEKVSSAGKARAQTPTRQRRSGGKNGFEVSPRGRIKAEIVDAFDAAH
ncbi:histone-like nucleoid-structuring protein Lsr2 [Rhodococcus baikonurensis]|uniref:Lsr2 family protein n=1 Tax=Rhodococcus baikonurensis TaxID=172041 RepID=A0ABV5XFG3_9NOCA